MTTVPWQGRSPLRNPRWIVWVLLVVPIAVVLLYPLAQDYLRAASLLQRIADPKAAGWIASYDVHPVEVRDTSFAFRGATIPARLYMPRGVGSAPGIVVVHGMHEMGMDGPRLVNFARALAANGFSVMTPQLSGLANYRVEAESADLIGASAQDFARDLQVQKVGVLAISFAGGLALLAASDPQYAASIAWVATVGGHYDLAHVLRFFATGDAVRPDGTVEHLAPNDYGSLIVLYDEPQNFFPPQDVQTAHDAIKLLLTGNGKASEDLTKSMSPAGQQVMQLLYHQQRQALAPGILAEVERERDQLAAGSPAGHLRSLTVPVLLLHGSDDSVIPPTELLWLKREIPQEQLLDALVSPAIIHVEVGDKVTLRDRLALVHWIAVMLRTARLTEAKPPTKQPAGAWIAAAPMAH